jgi:transcriptional regulator with XRE-family HTH domain
MAARKKYNTTEAILKRLDEFLQTAGIGDTLAGIAEKIGVSRGYFSTIRNKRAEIGVDKIVRIFLLYPQLSSDWLLMDSGTMLKAANSLKDQSELLVKGKALKTAVDGLSDLQNQIRQLQFQISKTKLQKAKK